MWPRRGSWRPPIVSSQSSRRHYFAKEEESLPQLGRAEALAGERAMTSVLDELLILYDRVGHGDRAGCRKAANLSKASCEGGLCCLRTSFRLRPVAAIEMRFVRISP